MKDSIISHPIRIKKRLGISSLFLSIDKKNLRFLVSIIFNGAADENRTHVVSLEG